MKLEHPLSGLIEACKTLCVPECCGVDAYDFSPINIACYLTRYVGTFNKREMHVLISQLEILRSSYGEDSSFEENRLLIEEMNNFFTKADVELLVQEILENIQISEQLAFESESKRKKVTLSSLMREERNSKKSPKDPK